MKIMPVIMLVFFYKLSAGLVLYWVTSNILTIGQQFIFNNAKEKDIVE